MEEETATSASCPMDNSSRSGSTTRGTNVGKANGEEQSAPSVTDKTTSTEAVSGLSPDDAELVHLVAEHHKGRSHSIEITTVEGEEKEKPKSSGIHKVLTSPLVGWMTLVLISYITYPGSLAVHHSQQLEDVTVGHVWYYGWITALSTGLGVLPLIFVPHLDKFWIGVSNAMAAGMMTAASYSLLLEGCTFKEESTSHLDWSSSTFLSSTIRTALGALLGLAFILGTQKFLDQHEDLKVGTIRGADAKKIILIMFVMTLHSFTEGVGIGVSFGGGKTLGVFISASLAVHNVPEGLAVAIVLLPRHVSKGAASLWCVLTSLPQPLMAVPAYIFVHHFIPFLPLGLGFAGGAMAWVAFAELLVEAYEDTDILTTGLVSTISLAIMMTMQNALRDG